MQTGPNRHRSHPRPCVIIATPAARRAHQGAADARRRWSSTGVSSYRQTRVPLRSAPARAPGGRTAPVLKRCRQLLCPQELGLDLLGSEIFKLPGVAIRDYGPGERLGGDTTERLKKLYVYVRDGAIGLRVAAGRSLSALVD